MKYLVLVLILLYPCAASGQDKKLLRTLQIGEVAAQGLDVYSTHRAFERGFIEGNLFLPSTIKGIVLYKTPITVGTVCASEWLFNKGRHKAAYATLIIGMVLPLAAFIHNEYMIYGQGLEAVQKTRSISFTTVFNF